MRPISRRTRRASPAHPLAEKENRTNHGPSLRENTTMPSRKARHRLSTHELARLEDVFRKETHPSRQQKKDLATELGMDYRTITIWFQNKRQTSKRGQPLIESLDRNSGRTRADSSLRSVSSPSHNATLGASRVDPIIDPSGAEGPGNGLHAITTNLIIKIRPLLDSLNGLTSRPRERSESTELKNDVEDMDIRQPRTLSRDSIAPVESDRHDQAAEHEQAKGKAVKWKRIRSLEWACERQSKRRKLSREGYVRLGSDDASPDNARMDSALSLLSLASSAPVGLPADVMRGASLLLNFKHSWRRK